MRKGKREKKTINQNNTKCINELMDIPHQEKKVVSFKGNGGVGGEKKAKWFLIKF